MELIRFVFHDKTLPLAKIIGTGAHSIVLTFPYLWFFLPPYVDEAFYLQIGETQVFLLQAFILNHRLGQKLTVALVCLLVMNLASYPHGLAPDILPDPITYHFVPL